ncbi:FAS1 domain-containing protein [Annulohypoxylon maeteangense]|uniref:FAS1 domain-containing protein n=1 Tax=Annulohypoxylon maeteangense TaxID=1927788 RepID=UPI002007E278|nr:FAS1 domain-containing protein [Annulohypoxylon maeteangense]KAI0886015.1 FAS1 domain-containing protein [Annulohypoxylon maeteangense]
MRYSNALLPFVATAAAIVIPDEATAQQLVLDTEKKVENTASSWRKQVCHGANALLSSIEDTLDNAFDGLERQTNKLKGIVAEGFEIDIGSDITDFLSPSLYNEAPRGQRGYSTNLTVYQTIRASNHTTKFAKLLDDYPEMVDRLNGTSANITIFVPTDAAFEKIPDRARDFKPPKEFIEKLIKYHVLPGFYPASRILSSHTLPTAFEEEHLGNRPQRLRVSIGLFGVKLNFFTKVVYANLLASNGALHAIDNILTPPPPTKLLISLFPSKFSTLELAAHKSGFIPHHHHHSNTTHPALTGLTFFAPTNTAFKKLGPRANAFLFNSPKGLHFLRALLKYHVVANETLYSDAYYGHQKVPSDSAEFGGEVGEHTADGHFHIDLPTLLGDKHIAVDIARWHGFIRVKLNGHVGVAVQDALTKDGVVQVVDTVLIPPHPRKHRGVWDGESERGISVDELVERLGPYVEEVEGEEAGVEDVEVDGGVEVEL